MIAMDEAEPRLLFALVAIVGGTRRWVFQVERDTVRVTCYSFGSFLVLFNDIAIANRILHMEPPWWGELKLRFHR
jgi:hypothetical protein